MTQRQNGFWAVLSTTIVFSIASNASNALAEGIDAGLAESSPSAEIAPNEIPLETMEPAPPAIPMAPEASDPTGLTPPPVAPDDVSPQAITEPAPPVEMAPAEQQAPVYTQEEFAAPAISNEYTNSEEEILRSPTKAIESYEKLRRQRLMRQSETDWSFNITIAPKAFKATEFRQAFDGPVFSGDRPFFIGVLFSIERYLLKVGGYLSVGAEAGLYSAQPTNRFGTLLASFQSAGPYAQYQFRYFDGQWLVPTIRTQYEWVHYNYSFSDNHMSDSRFLSRVDLGALVYLNVLSPGDGARASADYGIKKMYFGAYYSMSQDRNQKHFDLTEKAFRGVLRFEF